MTRSKETQEDLREQMRDKVIDTGVEGLQRHF